MSLQQLKQELKENLSHKGTLNQVSATLRASIFQILSQASPESTKLPASNLTQSQVLLHLLIQDYLKWIGYKFTASVFAQEASLGSTEQEFSRDFLAKEIGMGGIDKNDLDVAVLYILMQKIVREKRGNVEVTDSLENLREAWMRHEREESSVEGETQNLDEESAYEEYSTDLEGTRATNETTGVEHDDTDTDNTETGAPSDDEDDGEEGEEQAFVLKR